MNLFTGAQMHVYRYNYNLFSAYKKQAAFSW